MVARHWETGRKLDDVRKAGPAYESEYAAIHNQRMALIRSYNMWYAIGFATSMGVFWSLVFMSLSVSSLRLMVAGGVIATCMIWFAYRVVLNIDRGVVELYPRIICLELVLDYDFYRDYLRRRPRGDTERSYIEECEEIVTDSTADLWRQVYSHFNAADFPGDRRITAHFRTAAYLSVAMYWVVIGVTVLPQYFGLGG